MNVSRFPTPMAWLRFVAEVRARLTPPGPPNDVKSPHGEPVGNSTMWQRGTFPPGRRFARMFRRTVGDLHGRHLQKMNGVVELEVARA